MATVTMTEFRRKFESLVALAEQGEVITVTCRGKPVIEMVKRQELHDQGPDAGLSYIPAVKK